MPNIFCITGFLGSGKTTLLNKILPLCLEGNKVAVIENDFGDTGIDAGLVAETGAAVRELASGCICCSLRGELKTALKSLIETEKPDLIFIEPSGISRSSDILSALKPLMDEGSAAIGNVLALVDVSSFEDYLDTFGDFYGDQIEAAQTVLFSHQSGLSKDELNAISARIKEMCPRAACLISDWRELDREALWEFISASPGAAEESRFACDPSSQGKAGTEVFSFWSGFPDQAFSREEMESALLVLAGGLAGKVLRAKGFCRASNEPGWHFDYLKGRSDIKPKAADAGGRVLVIGQNLNADKLAGIFRLQINN